MCELLALSSSHLARLTFSLHVLAARGGSTGVLHDGWGVASAAMPDSHDKLPRIAAAVACCNLWFAIAASSLTSFQRP